MPETDSNPKPFFGGTEPPKQPPTPALPAEPEDTSNYIFPSLDTEHLRRLRAQLRTNIPGDGTHAAAVSTLLGALVDFELQIRPPPVVTRQSDTDVGLWPHDKPAAAGDELEVLAT